MRPSVQFGPGKPLALMTAQSSYPALDRLAAMAELAEHIGWCSRESRTSARVCIDEPSGYSLVSHLIFGLQR